MANSTRKNTMYNMAYRLFSVLLPLATSQPRALLRYSP